MIFSPNIQIDAYQGDKRFKVNVPGAFVGTGGGGAEMQKNRFLCETHHYDKSQGI